MASMNGCATSTSDADLAGDSAPIDLGDTGEDGADSAMAEDLDEAPSDSANLDQEIGLDSGAEASSATSSVAADDLSLDSQPNGELSLEEPPPAAGLNEAPPPEPLPVAEAPPEPAVELPAAEPPPVAQQDTSSGVAILNMEYRSREAGGTFEVEATGPMTYTTRELPATNQVVVEIQNARLPDSLKRPFVMKDFKQTIASVSAYQEPGAATARVVIQFSRPAAAIVSADGTRLRISADGFATASAPDPAQNLATDSPGLEGAPSTEPSQGVSQDGAEAAQASSGRGGIEALPETSVDLGSGGRYTGRPINIQVEGMDVGEVVQLIADLSGANMILDSGITGRVNLKLRQVPWDQALLLVLRNFNLGYVRQGSILRIAPLERIQNEINQARAILESQRQLESPKVKVVPLSYATASEVVTTVNTVLASPGGAGGQGAGAGARAPSQTLVVSSDRRSNAIIIRGLAEDIDRAQRLVKSLDTPPLQVLIEAKIVEAGETFIRQSGFNFGAGLNLSSQTGGPGLNSSLGLSGGQAAGSFILSNVLQGLDPLTTLTHTLALAELRGEVKIISSPRILTVNSQEAKIAQISQIPIVSTTPATASSPATTTVRFDDAPLDLEVTPQVSFNQDIMMKVKLRRVFFGAQAAGSAAPEKNTREANTTVMVRNGQTGVIGGIYQSETTDTVEGIPGLKDLPFLGWLFRSKTNREQKNELLLFLTPRIVNKEALSGREQTL
jgi:type IV pilus assembly protein PilQ